MRRLKITAIRFLADYKLDISLSNGHGILYDISPQINTVRFLSLQNNSIYKNGSLLADDVISWPSGTELTLDEIFLELTSQMPYRLY